MGEENITLAKKCYLIWKECYFIWKGQKILFNQNGNKSDLVENGPHQ